MVAANPEKNWKVFRQTLHWVITNENCHVEGEVGKSLEEKF